jgi:alginate biosynthesis protein AlgX
MDVKRLTLFSSLLCLSLLGFSWSQPLSVCEAAKEDAKEWVVAGQDGWLFSAEDVTLPIKLGDSKAYVERFAQALEGQGILLVAVVNPRRGMVATQYFESSEPKTASFEVSEAEARYKLFLETLREAGIVAPDLLASIRALPEEESYFFKRDHHWTPLGARLAAQGVAQALSTNSVYGGLAKTAFTSVTDGATVPLEGGWSRRVKQVCQTTLPDEALPVYETTSQASVGLLDDVPVPEVVLVGTSYSKPEREPGYNFEGFLKEALSLDVLNEAVAAGGPFTALQSYFLSEEYRANKPAFIVWEMQIPVSRVFKNQSTYRQLIPSVYGACSLETALLQQSSELAGASSVILKGDQQAVQGSDYFLYLELSDTTLIDFEITLSYQDGQEETTDIERSTRLENSGEFFLELSSEIASPLASVTLNFPEAVTTTVEVRVCQVNHAQ